MQLIAFDSHKHYTLASVQGRARETIREERIDHERGKIFDFLSQWDKGSPVAVESIGSWYWIVEEIEKAQMCPRLVHARKAKLMMGMVNKTDKLDVRGLNLLQHTGTLPTVWIPPMEIRDKRELPRTRMVFSQYRTKLKNRIHSVIDKYGLQGEFKGTSDIFGKRGGERLHGCIDLLPQQTGYTLEILLKQLTIVEQQLLEIEKHMKEVFESNQEVKFLMTLPGVGFILAVVISSEIGDIRRFNSASNLASYSGTVPRVHASGDKFRYGGLRPDANRYLKWAFLEASNSVAVHRDSHPQRHVSRLYKRLHKRRNHAKAVGAVARHLAEATYWILLKKEAYRDRGLSQVLSAET